MLEKFQAKTTNHFSISFQNYSYYSFSKGFFVIISITIQYQY